ncbi:MAG: PqqD family protein [Candidatus Methanofastidiosia archaeon]
MEVVCIKDDDKPKKAERLITREEDESLLIFDPDTGSIKVLNETAGTIWNSIDGNISVRDIIEDIIKENPDEDEQRIREDVVRFLKELQELGYVTS